MCASHCCCAWQTCRPPVRSIAFGLRLGGLIRRYHPNSCGGCAYEQVLLLTAPAVGELCYRDMKCPRKTAHQARLLAPQPIRPDKTSTDRAEHCSVLLQKYSLCRGCRLRRCQECCGLHAQQSPGLPPHRTACTTVVLLMQTHSGLQDPPLQGMPGQHPTLTPS